MGEEEPKRPPWSDKKPDTNWFSVRVGSKYSCCALIELEQTTEALVTFDGTSMW